MNYHVCWAKCGAGWIPRHPRGGNGEVEIPTHHLHLSGYCLNICGQRQGEQWISWIFHSSLRCCWAAQGFLQLSFPPSTFLSELLVGLCLSPFVSPHGVLHVLPTPKQITELRSATFMNLTLPPLFQ